MKFSLLFVVIIGSFSETFLYLLQRLIDSGYESCSLS